MGRSYPGKTFPTRWLNLMLGIRGFPANHIRPRPWWECDWNLQSYWIWIGLDPWGSKNFGRKEKNIWLLSWCVHFLNSIFQFLAKLCKTCRARKLTPIRLPTLTPRSDKSCEVARAVAGELVLLSTTSDPEAISPNIKYPPTLVMYWIYSLKRS